MVLKRVSEAGGRGAGGFLGGFFNNPGVVAIAGIGLALFLFRDKISDAFGSLSQGLSSGIGNINLPDIQLPEITFPSIGDINLPEIKLPDVTFPEFNFPNPFEGNEGDPRAVPVPEFAGPDFAPGLDEIVAPELGRQDPRRQSLDVGEAPLIEDILPNQPASISDFINRFTTLSSEQFEALPERSQESILRNFPTSDPVEQASAIVPETQSQFQERAAAFVEDSPILTRSTSLPGSISSLDVPDSRFNDANRQLSRNSDDFQSVLDSEARRAEQIFQGLFGNVQNPDFPRYVDPVTGEVI